MQVVRNLYRELDAAGWAPTILVNTWAAAVPRDDSTADIRVLVWRVRSPLASKRVVKGFVAYLATLPATAWTWRRLAQHHRWRVVNLHFPDFAVLTWIVMKRLRWWDGLIVLSVHGRDVRDEIGSGRRLRRRLMRFILEGADAVVACAAELSQDVATLAPRAKDRISVIPNGVNADLLRAQPRRHFHLANALSRRRFILNVATFEHKKSQDVLIKAFASLAPMYADVDLVLVGRSTPWLEELRSQVRASNVADRVHFLCDLQHADIPELLSRASVFCLPSRSEGHPLAILEAAVFGLPVVATPVGGIRQTITDKSDGLLVPVGDVVTLSDALSRLLSNRALSETLGRSLQRRVETEFTWERAARLYTELAKSHGLMPEPRPRRSV